MGRSRSPLAACFVLLVALLLVAPGCTDGSTAPGRATTTGDGAHPRMHATLLQYRPDEGTNRLEVELTNRSRATVTVRSIQLSWGGVRSAPRTPKDTTYVPGQTIDLTTTYGVAVCHGAVPADPPRAIAVLAGGSVLSLLLDRHGADMLRGFRTRDCGLRRLAAIASFTLSSSFRLVHADGRDQLRGTLEVRRPSAETSTKAESLTVTDLTGSVLFTFTPADRLPVDLAPGLPVLRVPVLIGPEVRCDAHGLSQSTQTFLFSAYARIGGVGPQQRVILVPDDRVKAQAQAMLERACR